MKNYLFTLFLFAPYRVHLFSKASHELNNLIDINEFISFLKTLYNSFTESKAEALYLNQ